MRRPNRDGVLFPELDKGGHIDAKRRVSVRPSPRELAVDPDGGHRHHAVEVEIEPFIRLGGVNLETFAVPADPGAGEIGIGRTGVLGPLGGNRPVVGKIEQCPIAVVERALRPEDPIRSRPPDPSLIGSGQKIRSRDLRQPRHEDILIELALRQRGVAGGKAPAVTKGELLAADGRRSQKHG